MLEELTFVTLPFKSHLGSQELDVLSFERRSICVMLHVRDLERERARFRLPGWRR